MKARVKKTGENIDVYSNTNIINDETLLYEYGTERYWKCSEIFFEKWDDDFSLTTKIINWEQRRYEFAKASMQGMISSWIVKPSEKSYANNIGCLTEMSFDVADAMIKELKESEETK